ncbi:hypothetical protein GWK47_036763 [Chionoecetes opilio]|uniref:Uncharacterized protein n=1 Tax=Chionoecetes opilio TaxID=41210 RepID=A0A8J4YNK9_CHIOP|nr:hypothetical protein GWK47_036763 [Chionoecetes opilio]
MPVFEAVVSKQKAMILSLTPASSNLLQDHCSHVSASRIRACRDPKKELGVIFPCERTAMRSSVSPERDGRSFPSQCRTYLRYLLVPQFHDLLGGLLSPAIRARWTVLFETAILPMSIPRT